MTEIKFNVLIAEDEENIGNLKNQWLQTNHSNYRKSGDPVCGIILSGCNLIRPWTTGYGWNRCDLRDQKMGSYSDHRDFCKEQRIRESKSSGCRSR